MSDEATVLISMFGIAAGAVSVGIICITYMEHLKVKALCALAQIAAKEETNGRP